MYNLLPSVKKILKSSMSIKIIKAGAISTLQDAGRFGHRNIGVGSGGAMDVFAMTVANYLCGNGGQQPVIEINFPAPQILFEEDAVISLAGADFDATINDNNVPVWRTLLVKKDAVLKFKQPLSGAKLYLAVHGGWQEQQWLNSGSTHLKLGAGGYFGRALQKDDIIHCGSNKFLFEENKILPWQISLHELGRIYQPQNIIRCIKGAEYNLLNVWSKQKLKQNNFIINNQSDRMGIRLTGNSLSLKQSTELISSVVDAGVVQLLPEGNCIVLMADHQTTGGYPRIVSVIKADLPRLSQLSPGKVFRFKIITIKEAEDALMSMLQMLSEIKYACDHNLNKYLQH